MRVRPGLTVMLAAAALAAGCGGDDEEEEGEAAGECGAVATAMSGSPDLPSGFPMPDGVTYTDSREAGPSTIVEGYTEEDLEDTFEAYKDGFEEAADFDVTKDEREEDDAEVNFAGSGTDGQVRLRECEERTTIQITVRPV